MSVSQLLRSRYLASSYDEIAKRLIRNLSMSEDGGMARLLRSQTLVPAGNILSAFGRCNGSVVPLRPNCAVLEVYSDNHLQLMKQQARELWATGTGVGFLLNGVSDPVAALHELHDACESVETKLTRPRRGNMAVLSSLHPRVLEFIDSKNTVQNANQLYLFNITVSFPNVHALLHQKHDDKLLLQALSESAVATGCPGIVLEDRLQRTHHLPLPNHWYRALVPCGEQSMFHGETCALASIHLNSDELWDEGSGSFDTGRLSDAVAFGVQMLNTVLDKTEFVTSLTRNASLRYRRIGLGVTGFSDALVRQKIRYGSDASVEFARVVASVLGGAGRVVGEHYGNVTSTCLPPTGGLTLLLPETRGFSIEPFFAEALSVPVQQQLAIASAFQEHVCNSVSKTLQLPQHATSKDVQHAFAYAASHTNLKCLSVYRDGSRSQPMSLR